MVVIAPPQQNDLDQKKRKQTLERAKANHLSKQLQMRLQYAKLKVEHGWQRQNLNEVENLYFHHSHLRNMSLRHGATKHQPLPTTTTSPVHADTAPSGPPDRTVPSSPSANDPPSGSQSPSEQAPATDALHSSQQPPALAPSSATTDAPPPPLDLSDPNILARLAQLQAQITTQSPSPSQTPAQAQSQPHQPPTAAPPPTSASTPAPQPSPVPTHPSGSFVQLPPGFAFPAYAPQPILGISAPGPVPFYPILAPHAASQPPASAPAAAPTVPVPIPTSATIAPTALTYDSFWSTHASSTGSTRALYRTHTGFTASAAPGGNVAMLTPGGHAAVMTPEGVYVGGASSKSSSAP